MEISVNGELYPLSASVSVTQLLEIHQTDPSTVVIEINQTIIGRNAYQDTMLQDRDQVEILRFVGGG